MDSSSTCHPDRFWLLTSACLSVVYGLIQRRYGRWNGQPPNDRTTRPWLRSDSDRKVGAPRESTARPQTGDRSGLLATQIGGHVVRPPRVGPTLVGRLTCRVRVTCSGLS